MRKVGLFLVLLAFGVTLSCNSSGKKELDEGKNINDQEKTETKAQVQGTIKLTKQDFLKKVMNYEVNQTTWKYEGDLPCIIDFYADWCAPCRMVAPVLEDLAKEYAGKIYIYKVDTQKERELASVFGIQGIPAFLFCPMDGKPQMSSGIARTPEQTKEMFRNLIKDILIK